MPSKIPKRFYKYFWDVDPEKTDVKKYGPFVAQRLLEWNDFPAARWVLNSFPESTLRESLTKIRGWSRRSANFWANYLGVPSEEVLCLRQGFPNPPQRLWNY